MLHWALIIVASVGLVSLAVFANGKLGTVRKKDQRPHQVPWGLVMLGCGFGLFLIVVHILNLAGVSTGPENSLFG